jgi:hypothetical protein
MVRERPIQSKIFQGRREVPVGAQRHTGRPGNESVVPSER